MNRIYTIIEACAKKSNLFPLIGLLIFWNILMNTPGLPTSTPSMQKIAPSFTHLICKPAAILSKVLPKI